MKQLNKSQMFNSSDSSNYNSSSSSNPHNSSNRRSMFRESYIDEDGALRSFSVYQDVIDESGNDSTRDISLSGLSSFSMRHVQREQQQTHEPNNSNILADLDSNSRIYSAKGHGVSRSGSLREFHLRKKHSQAVKDHSSSSNSGDSVRNSRESLVQGIRQPVSQSSSESERSRPSQAPQVQIPRIPTPEFAAPLPPTTSSGAVEDATGTVVEIHDISVDNLRLLREIHDGTAPRKDSSSGGRSSKSLRSITQDSIRQLEETRRRQRGTPHLIQIQNAERIAIQKAGTPQPVVVKSEAYSGIVPSIHSPTSPLSHDMAFEPNQLRDGSFQRKPKPFKAREMHLKPKRDEPSGLERPSSASASSMDDDAASNDRLLNEKGDDYPSDNSVLQRIRYDRELQSISTTRTKARNRWFIVIYLIAFIIPPLFFFLGFGLLDDAIGHTTHIKRYTSLGTGVLWLLIAFAMIGVGFGVGISQAS